MHKGGVGDLWKYTKCIKIIQKFKEYYWHLPKSMVIYNQGKGVSQMKLLQRSLLGLGLFPM